MAIYLSYLLSGQRAGVCALLLYIIGFHSHIYVTARSRWRYALSANHRSGIPEVLPGACGVERLKSIERLSSEGVVC